MMYTEVPRTMTCQLLFVIESHPSLFRTPLSRIFDKPDRFRPPENFEVMFTLICQIPATSCRDNTDTFPADVDRVRE